MLFRVNYVSRRGTVDIVNTLHVKTKDANWIMGDNSDDPSAVIDEVDSALTATYRTLLDTSSVLDRITATQVPDPNNPTQVPAAAEKAKNLAGLRTLADENLPHELCGLLSLKSDKSGRYARGRMFLPPVEATNALSGESFLTTSNYWTNMGNLAAKIQGANFSDSSWSNLWNTTWTGRIVVYSRTRHMQNISPFTFNVKLVIPREHPSWLRSRRK